MTIDLPAPVSPVRTLKPLSKAISACSMTAIFSICRVRTASVLPPVLSGQRQCVDLLADLRAETQRPTACPSERQSTYRRRASVPSISGMFSLSIASSRAVGKTRHGLDDDHVLRVIHAGHALPEDQIQLGRERMLHRLRRGRIAIGPVRPKLLDDAQLLDVAGNGRLRGLEAALRSALQELLLRLRRCGRGSAPEFFPGVLIS